MPYKPLKKVKQKKRTFSPANFNKFANSPLKIV